MSYYVLIGIIIVIILLFIALYLRGTAERHFAGRSITEGGLTKKLIDSFMPPKSSASYITQDDMLYILDSSKSLRDLYFLKIISVIAFTLIGVAITITNIGIRKDEAFKVSTDMPISISESDYEVLTKGVLFTQGDEKYDYRILRQNSKSLENKDTVTVLENTTDADMYNCMSIINNRLNTIYSWLDPLIILLFILFGGLAPGFILKRVFILLASKTLFEFDNLETLILMNCDEHIEYLLLDLQHNSLFYRTFFYNFRLIYNDSHEQAYSTVANRKEFPERFKKLIRYLNMLETNGPNNTRIHILNNKDLTQEDVFDELMKTNRKKIKVLNIICGISFMLGFVRLFLSLF